MSKNILHFSFNSIYNTTPFSKIKNSHFLPAFKKAIKKASLEIDAIANNIEAPSFTNTIEALDFSGEHLDRISSIFFNLNAAETNETIQKIAQEVSPLLSEFSNDIILNEALFKRIKTVYNCKNTLNLTSEQETLLEKKTNIFQEMGLICLPIKKLNFVK